jgi:hypothetical protein
MNTVQKLVANIRKIGGYERTAAILRMHPDLQDISVSTLYRWTHAKKSRPLVEARMRLAVEALTGVVPEKKSDDVARVILKDILDLEQKLRRKIRMLEKLM